jgi:hypothetical protein
MVVVREGPYVPTVRTEFTLNWPLRSVPVVILPVVGFFVEPPFVPGDSWLLLL